MAARSASNGRVLFSTSGDTFDGGGSAGVQPRALIWAGGTTANHKAAVLDADGVTQVYLSIAAAGDHAVLDGHFFGEARPYKAPITVTFDSGIVLMVV